MAKHTCDTNKKHAKVTNVHCSRPGISFSYADVSVSGVESQAGCRRSRQHVPQDLSHRTNGSRHYKDSSPRAGGWDKNYKLATAASNAMGRAPSHPRTCMLRRDEEEFNNGSSGKMVSKLTHDRSHNPCPKPIKSY